MEKPFVIISGLPASGKTTLARRLAPALNLPVIDKDEILERLFGSSGVGDSLWRRRLSRESDALLESEATSSNGAVLSSFWRLSGMPADSGTPVGWLAAASPRIVNVRCACDPAVAAWRFIARTRHPGHGDGTIPFADLLASFQDLLRLGPLDIGVPVDADTSLEPELDAVVRDIHSAFQRCPTK